MSGALAEALSWLVEKVAETAAPDRGTSMLREPQPEAHGVETCSVSTRICRIFVGCDEPQERPCKPVVQLAVPWQEHPPLLPSRGWAGALMNPGLPIPLFLAPLASGRERWNLGDAGMCGTGSFPDRGPEPWAAGADAWALPTDAYVLPACCSPLRQAITHRSLRWRMPRRT